MTDCKCSSIDPKLCTAELHKCQCLIESVYYSRQYKDYCEYNPSRGYKHCRSEFHHCRCYDHDGFNQCKSVDHKCVCVLHYDYGKKKCNAKAHLCLCSCYPQ